MHKQNPNDPTVFQLLNEVGIIEQLSRNQLERVLPDGLKMSQFVVLNRFVRMGDGETPAQLASAFQVTKGAMTNTLKRLQDRGFIEVRPDQNDGRSKRVYMTDAGRAARQTAVTAVAAISSELTNQIPLDELAELLPGLIKLRSVLDKMRD